MRIIFLFFLVFFVGCQNPGFYKITDDGVIWIQYSAVQRGALLIPTDTKYKVIVEPSPDAGTNKNHDVALSGGYAGAEGSVNYQNSYGMFELGKRSDNVFLLREALFRLNVFSVNYDLPPETFLKIYDEILLSVRDLILTDRENAERAKIKALDQSSDEVKELYLPGILPKK